MAETSRKLKHAMVTLSTVAKKAFDQLIDLEKDLTGLKKENGELKEQLNLCQKENTDLRQFRNDLQNSLAAKSQECEELRKVRDEQLAEITSLQSKLKEEVQARQSAQDSLCPLRRRVKRRVRAPVKKLAGNAAKHLENIITEVVEASTSSPPPAKNPRGCKK